MQRNARNLAFMEFSRFFWMEIAKAFTRENRLARADSISMNLEWTVSMCLRCQKLAYTVGVSLEEHTHTGKNDSGPFPPWPSGAPNAIQKKKTPAFCFGVRLNIFFVLLEFIFSFLFPSPGGERKSSEAQQGRSPRRRFLCFFPAHFCFAASLSTAMVRLPVSGCWAGETK